MCVADKQTELDNLFEEWKKAHSEEDDESCKKTFPKKNGDIPKCVEDNNWEFKNNWTDDGFLNDNATCKILYILKESNICGNEKCLTTEPIFWLKENRTKYRKAIPRRLKKLTAKLLNLTDSSQWYEYAAMMNINKRGGFSKCDFKQLLGYAEEYKENIQKEIELLNPEIIVLLGEDFYKEFSRVSSYLDFKDKKIYFHYHPSRKGEKNSFTDAKFLEPIESIG